MTSTESEPAADSESINPANLAVRLIAILYDGFLLLALLFIATLPVTFLYGEALHGQWWFRVYLLLVGYAFFGWFWTHGGRTLGMQAWRLRVERNDGRPLDWLTALRRYLAALLSWAAFGIGFLWSLFDARRRTWHDLLSDTRLVRIPKRQD